MCKNARSCATILFCVDMASGDGTAKPDMQGRFFVKNLRAQRFSERTAVPPSPPWRSPGDTLQKAFYRLLTVKLRFPGGLRGFVAENVPECRLIFLCENPDLLFLLWWGKGAPFSGERDGFAPFRAVFRGLVEMWLHAAAECRFCRQIQQSIRV